MGVKVRIQGNAVAYLTLDPDLHYFHEVIRFLLWCPLSHALCDLPFIDKKVLHHFWNAAVLADPIHIPFVYKKHVYQFSSKDVADALYLPRDIGVTSYGRDILKYHFEAIGLKVALKTTIKKSNLRPKWRVITEVLLWCFSSKMERQNEISQVMQQMMFSLNIGYNFDYAGYVFETLKK